MPTYNYKCITCNNEFEIKQKISEEPLVYCEECGQPTLEKVIYPSVVIYKGNNWFKNSGVY